MLNRLALLDHVALVSAEGSIVSRREGVAGIRSSTLVALTDSDGVLIVLRAAAAQEHGSLHTSSADFDGRGIRVSNVLRGESLALVQS